MPKRAADGSSRDSNILKVLKVERVARHHMSDSSDDPLLSQAGSPEAILPLPHHISGNQDEIGEAEIEEINSENGNVIPTKRFKGENSPGTSDLVELSSVYPDYLMNYDSPSSHSQDDPAIPSSSRFLSAPLPMMTSTPSVSSQNNLPIAEIAEPPACSIKIEKTSDDGSVNEGQPDTPSRGALNDSGYFDVGATPRQTPPRNLPVYKNEAITSFAGHQFNPYGNHMNYGAAQQQANGQEVNHAFQQQQQFPMVPFPYHGMPMFANNPEMSIQQQHFQRLQQLLMHQHQWENRCVPQYYNGHDISPTKIKITSTTERVTSPGPIPQDFDPEVHGSTSHPILVKISKYALTSASTGINFYFRIFGKVFKARRDSFSKDKTMMYLRCNTCPKEPCKWRAKIRLLKPEIKIEDEFFQVIENYQVLSNSKAHHHHPACRELSLTDEDMVG